jgi:hypothetical protein
MMSLAQRPGPGEFASSFAGYVAHVPDGDVIATLSRELQRSETLLGRLPAAKADFRYAPGKWSLKEVLGHVIDAEWIFTYRALCFARGDKGPLPSMDQDQFMAGANFASLPLATLLAQFRHLRSASTLLFSSFGPEVLERRGVASGNEFSVRALPWIIAGHGMHHLGVIESRYL